MNFSRIRNLSFLTFLLISLALFTSCAPETADDLQTRIINLPGVEAVEKLDVKEPHGETYKIMLSQPLDHDDPSAGTFTQKLYLSHIDFSKPMVMITEGYAANSNSTHELSMLLAANQLKVEHRYFGESQPENPDWNYLTVRQAANDHHAIIELFKGLYDGKWVTTGGSKGGQTTLIHQYFYSTDVDAAVPYVAPMNRAEEDPRIYNFLDTIGTEECRQKIRDFQVQILQRRQELLPLLQDHGDKMQFAFSIGLDVALEYAALEYDFAFWQYGRESCGEIPGADASAAEMMDHLSKVVPFYFYSDKGIKAIGPFFYQAYTELGYYGYQEPHLDNLLKVVTNPTNKIFAPKDAEVTFNPMTMAAVIDWLESQGNNIIYIYGALDTWSACAVNPSDNTNAVKIVHPGGFHSTRIKDLDETDRSKVISALQEWLEVEIN